MRRVRTVSAPPPPAPPGLVVLGIDRLRQRPVIVALPAEVGQHVTLLGVTGSGKTTTAQRLLAGALVAGMGVLVVDAKGGGLRAASRRLADSAGVGYVEMVPGAGESRGYNPGAVGSASQVADKLVSAFSHGPSGQVYAVIAQEALAILTGVLRALGEPVTVRRLRTELERSRMTGLAHKVRDLAPALAVDLAELATRVE